jgi:DNA-binding beta-propeller fold protein YncE
VPRTFDCPKCGAPLNYSENVGAIGLDHTVKCNYCSSVIAEPTMGRPAHVVHIKLDNAVKNIKVPRIVWILLIGIPVLAVSVVVIAMVVGFATAFRASSARPPRITTPPRLPSNTNTDAPKGGEAGIAAVLMKFGSEGIGPGMFKDARSIAVDGSGKIYVGEYTGGRVQVFDPEGKFLTQWSVDPKMPLRSLAADRKGNVYVVQSGLIQTYEGSSGKNIGTIKYAGGWGFDDVIVTADSGLVTTWYKGSDDIVKFDASGNAGKTIKAAISSVSGDSELDMEIAVDGLGNIYALGTFNKAVFKFGPDGKFINRFGGAGEQPGQFRAPGSIAVDGRGRVYVSDIKGIQMFDGNGRYLDTFKADGSNASGMVFNDQNELFVVARTKVVKLSLRE